ncbi:RNA polymerase Rpb1 C-terminal repeat domain-containing protein [Paecilomyces variotii No. 5]|uniref:RNA polymerase Rpb1 C-terminal repeat domain-containing protein n=1 Tax=Byssochlamys spectabilis (strain No. 5 / NBRC 109023) TaxID=1356009 RepID=V5FLF8_BYSSN|nr:RNA polymerase Rpb1 C-terminal repeat domain-containing protein [Paecilomyces variotii No. 5]
MGPKKNKKGNNKNAKKAKDASAKPAEAQETPPPTPGSPPSQARQEELAVEEVPTITEQEPLAPQVAEVTLDQETPETPKLDLEHKVTAEDEVLVTEPPKETPSPPQEDVAEQTQQEPETTTAEIPVEEAPQQTEPVLETNEVTSEQPVEAAEPPIETAEKPTEVTEQPVETSISTEEPVVNPEETVEKPEEPAINQEDAGDKLEEPGTSQEQTGEKPEETSFSWEETGGKPAETSVSQEATGNPPSAFVSPEETGDKQHERNDIHNETNEINEQRNDIHDQTYDNNEKYDDSDEKFYDPGATPVDSPTVDDRNHKFEGSVNGTDDSNHTITADTPRAAVFEESKYEASNRSGASTPRPTNGNGHHYGHLFKDTTKAPTVASPIPRRSPPSGSVRAASPSLTETRLGSSPPPEHRPIYPASPAYSYSKPVPKVGSPLVRPYMPYMTGHNDNIPGPTVAASIPPSTAPSFTTAQHSPTMSAAALPPYAGFQGFQGFQHHRSGSIASGRGPFEAFFNSPYQPVREPSVKGAPSDTGTFMGDFGDTFQLLERIQSAIPDLGRLLSAHRETQGKLNAREAEIKQLEARHQEELMHKDFYVQALKDQMKKAASDSAEECGRLNHSIKELKSEIGYLRDKKQTLEENLEATQKENDELSHTKLELQAEIEQLNLNMRQAQEHYEMELQTQREHEQSSLATQKQDLTDAFTQMRAEDERAAAEALENREKELLFQQQKMKEEMEAARAKLEREHEAAMTEKQAELDSTAAELKSTQDELAATKTELESKIAELEATHTELEATKTKLSETETELGATKSELDSTKTELGETKAELDTTKTELDSTRAELDSTKTELDSTKNELESTKNELESTKTELESTKTELSETKTELDTTKTELESTKTELGETKAELESTKTELESTKAELESTKAELDSTKNELESTKSELESTKTELETKISELEATTSELESTKAELESTKSQLEATTAELESTKSDLESTKSELETTTKELETKKTELAEREKQLQSAIEEMRSTVDNMDKERERLKKTLHSLGEATDLKSTKGDTFFLECFGKLQHLIIDLSKKHFGYLPIDPPKDILAKIPSELPSFLDNTPASCELRAAYIQHVISKTLTYRIFQPFLFTLGRRFDKADTFFQLLSIDIRRKSVRREAFWRQQTLKAAYTTSDAKQSINVVAAVIVDEIIEQIRHFADPKKLDDLLTGVRMIVKLAAETWRHARVERELVTASMPAPSSEGVANEHWDEYPFGRDESRPPSRSSIRHVVLRTFPRIFREAAHEDFADDEERRNSCVYMPGMVLYSDSPVVLSRIDELAKRSSDSLDGVHRSPRGASRRSTSRSPVKRVRASVSPAA